MEVIIELNIEALEEGGFLATSDDIQGFLAQGRTYAETIEIAQDVARKIIESHIEHGDDLPEKIKIQLTKPNQELRFKIPVAISQ